jgi:tetratricopeptide (TPR) repeat protein
LKRKLVFSLIATVIILVGALIGVRVSASSGIAYNPADEGYCEKYGITINTDQVEAIYLHPETILADPEAFLSRDIASLMLANHHAQTNDPLDLDRWVKQIKRIAGLTVDERETQLPYQLTEDVIAGKETFCKIVVPHIYSYLPEWADVSTTFYQTALDPMVSGFHNRRGGIVVAVSHPLYINSEKLFRQGSSSIYNIMAHELFHRAYKDAWLWQRENPVENDLLREFLSVLQNDGMAVNTAYKIKDTYPSSFDFTYPLHDFEPYVGFLIGQMNRVFDDVSSKPTNEFGQSISRLYRRSVHYIVGGYMAGKIEDELGRGALVATVATGPVSFIQTYNSVADDGKQVHIPESAQEFVSPYQDLRSAALDGDLASVREYVDILQASAPPQLDNQADGYLIYTSGYILLESGHLDLAEAIFQAHIRLLPQVGAAYVGLGDVYAQKGNIPAAIENYERAIEIDPRNQWVAVIIQEFNKNDD